MTHFEIQLPAPPSDNRRLMLGAGGKRTLNKEYRNWRDWAALMMRSRARALKWKTAEGGCVVHAKIHIGMNRDIQNCAKAMCDALTLGGIYGDDRQVNRLVIERVIDNSVPKGEMVLEVKIDDGNA